MKDEKIEKPLAVAVIGHKRVPACGEGGIEVVVEELSTRMVQLGHKVTCYNRSGHHVCGREFDGEKLTEYKGVRIKTVLIKDALLSVYPSEWYENCPFSVIESMRLGTPVLGANIGGIPELIDDKVNGELFKSGDTEELSECITNLWMNRDRVKTYTENCKNVEFDTVALYTEKLLRIYQA